MLMCVHYLCMSYINYVKEMHQKINYFKVKYRRESPLDLSSRKFYLNLPFLRLVYEGCLNNNNTIYCTAAFVEWVRLSWFVWTTTDRPQKVTNQVNLMAAYLNFVAVEGQEVMAVECGDTEESPWVCTTKDQEVTGK